MAKGKCTVCRNKRCVCRRFDGSAAKAMYEYYKKGGRNPGEGFNDLVKFSQVTGMSVTYKSDLVEEAKANDVAASVREVNSARLAGMAKSEHRRLTLLAEDEATQAKLYRDKQAYANAVASTLG